MNYYFYYCLQLSYQDLDIDPKNHEFNLFSFLFSFVILKQIMILQLDHKYWVCFLLELVLFQWLWLILIYTWKVFLWSYPWYIYTMIDWSFDIECYDNETYKNGNHSKYNTNYIITSHHDNNSTCINKYDN